MPEMNKKIERKWLGHFLNTAAPGEDAAYERIGVDLEEYNVEHSAQVEKKQNILGQTSVKVTGYQKQASVAPYYAEKGSALHTRLQAIIDDELVLDDLRTDMIDVKLWETPTGNAYPAIREEVYIEVTSHGGNASGYQIPFNVHYTGVKTKGTFDPAAKTFTPAEE